MMPRIHQLPPTVVSKIAAGEVIERPASVLKELLENSVDAEATRIEIDVEQGGVELLRVVDNGCGIVAEDLQLAFASHATSKLATADDLFRIGTLGFRGEALASIGGIAQVCLQSRPRDSASGSEITCHGGELSAVKPWNGATGTRLEVRHLFYNTPVRRKFLRTTATEMGHITESFTRLALPNTALHLVLRHNSKLIHELSTSDLRERIALFFGAEVADKLYAVDVLQGVVRMHGFIADPSVARGHARMQYLFLNGRWFRDRSLGHALQEGYRGLLMTGRYPVAFLFLEMQPDLVDVNVHPTKSEVRFRDGHALYSMMLNTVRTRLNRENLVPQLQLPSTLPPPQVAPRLSEPPLFAPPRDVVLPPPPVFPRPLSPAEPGEVATPVLAEQDEPQPTVADDRTAAAAAVLALPETKVIQLYNTYLVVETANGMLVIDQHALHERILFEQLKRRMREGSLESQTLLIPEPVELSAQHAALVLDHRVALAELGLQVEDFGGGTLLLHSYPAILGQRPPQAILQAVVDHLVSKERAPTREQLLNNLLSLMACHSAVRAGDPLTPEQIAALLAQRQLADDTHHCPHGRPTALLFSRSELERQFGRI